MYKTYKNIIAWDSSMSKALPCDIVTEGKVIKNILPPNTGNRNVVFNGKGTTAVIPGFSNAHGHAAMTLLRGVAEELPLMEWLEKKIWPLENKLTPELVRAGADLAIMEMLATGTTSFADMYFFMDQVAEAALDAQIRCCLSRGIVNDNDGSKLKENLKLASDFHGRNELLTVCLGPHAPYTVSIQSMKNIARVAKETNLGVQLHWLETSTEWDLSGLRNKTTPEDYLIETGMIEVPSLLLSHGVWIKDTETSFYNKDNITIVHNPKSNMKLGSGFAPLTELLANKVSVALGTDGAASNNKLDIWEEIRFAALIHKGNKQDSTTVTASEVLKMATINGAKAMGFKNTGLIKEGYNADMILIDLDQAHYVGWDLVNLPNFIVYAGSSKDIKKTIVAGNILYDKGVFKTIDRNKTLKRAIKARESLINK